MQKRKVFLVLLMGLYLNLFFAAKPAKAWPSVAAIGSDAVFNAGSLGVGIVQTPLQAGDLGTNLIGTGGTLAQLAETLAKFAADNLKGIVLIGLKVLALKGVQVATHAIMGKGETQGGVVTDWSKYLYNNPKQVATTQMKSFFNTVSKGRSSVLNYEGVSGINYDGYLIRQAEKAIEGQALTTNLQAYASDPTQLYAAGNFKGMSTLGECGNNVPCYTMMSQARYATELDKATTVAKNEQKDGILPVKKNGNIIQPAAILANAFGQIDQQGERLIMDAKASEWPEFAAASQQIIAGTALSIAARGLNYATTDAKGKAAARNKNDSFPFSISYSSNSATGGQLNVTAGGTTVSTNANTQKVGGATLDNLGSNLMNTATQTAISTACAGLAANSPVRIPGGITTKCPTVINKAIK